MFAWTRYRKKYKNDPTHCDRCGWDLQGYGRCPECGGKGRLRKEWVEGPQWRNPQLTRLKPWTR